MNEFSNFFNIFHHFAVAWYPKHSSSSTDTQLALEHECHSKTTVRLKECSPKAAGRIPWVSVMDLSNFTQNLVQTYCLILASIADRTKHEVEKVLM
jgi:hypothetical protein